VAAVPKVPPHKLKKKRLSNSVVVIATGWTTEGPEFESGRVKNCLHVVQTGSGALLASYPICTEDSFPRGKVVGT
jgi:hypothetical protein